MPNNIPTLSNYTTHFPQYLKYYNLESLENNAWQYMKWFHNQSQYTLCASTETFGNVVLEAMASGIPAIAPNAGGVKDIISHEFYMEMMNMKLART